MAVNGATSGGDGSGSGSGSGGIGMFGLVVGGLALLYFLVRYLRTNQKPSSSTTAAQPTAPTTGGASSSSSSGEWWGSSASTSARYVLRARTMTSADSALLSFAPHAASDALVIGPGRHIYVFFPTAKGQQKRPYSPVHCDSKRMDLLIKVYPDGVGSTYMHGLKIGEAIEIKGPVGRFDFAPIATGQTKHIGMICGGTGITPAYQLLRGIYESKQIATKPRVHLLYSNRTSADILLREELETLAKTHPEFTVNFYLSSSPAGRCCAATLECFSHMHKPGGLIIVCGPPTFETNMLAALDSRGWGTSATQARFKF